MSFIIDVPIDSGVFDSGDDGDATAVEPSVFVKCIFGKGFSRFFTVDAIMNDFLLTVITLSVHFSKFLFLLLGLKINQFFISSINPLRDGNFFNFMTLKDFFEFSKNKNTNCFLTETRLSF